jgi:hypothetical protein
MPERISEHREWTAWRELDPGGAWTGTSVSGGAFGVGTGTVDLRLLTTPTPPAALGGQVAIEATSLDSAVWRTSEGTDVSSEVTATLTQRWTLLYGPASGVYYVPLQLEMTNASGRPVYLDTAAGQLRYMTRDAIYKTTEVPTTTGPTGGGGGSGTNARNLLEKANPGFICRITYVERYDLLGTVELGHRINLTIPELGIVNRGHVVTAIKHHFEGQVLEDAVPSFILTSTFTLEKIPGTLLPGAGTSSDEQDDAGTGAEIGAYLRFDDSGSGFGLGAFAP